MTDKRTIGGAMPWSGGLSRIVRPILVEDNDMVKAQNVLITLDTVKRKRMGTYDEYGVVYTTPSEEGS